MSSNDKSLSELLEDAQTLKGEDVIDDSVKAIVSLFPGVSQFYNDLVKSPATKRLNNFLEAIVKEIEELQQKSFDQVNLEKESFKTILNYALQIASRNHQEEKINALKNTVLNSALIDSIEEDKQLIFLRYIDELTPSHLKVLNYMNNIPQYIEEHIISQKKDDIDLAEIEKEFPFLFELKQESKLYNQLIKDLEDRGLVNFDNARQKSYMFADYGFKPSMINGIQFLKNEISNLPKSEDIKKLTNILNKIVETEIKIAEFIDNLQIQQLDYVNIILGNKYGNKKSNDFYFINQVTEKRITELGQLFLKFITSPT